MPERNSGQARSLVLIAILALGGAAAWYVFKGRGAPAADSVAGLASPAPKADAAASAPPISVSLVRAERRDVPVVLEATGTVSALTSVDVKPQVASVITQVHVKEGQFVRRGDLLFTLDSRTDQANLGKAQAQLQKDLAALADAQRQFARSQELQAQSFISQGAVDTSRAQLEAQQAVVAADRAAIDAARVALSYARIAAPSGGRVGQIPVVAGSTVQPGGAALVTITQLDPIGVAFNLPQRNLPDALAALRGSGAPVQAQLPDGRGTLAGRLQFVDNAVDAATGTVRVKAQFDNREQRLWPGAFVGVRLAVRTLKDAVVVPQAAIVQSPRGAVVFVVDEGSRVAARPVQLLHASGNDAAVQGLAGGERIVLEGRQNVRPGNLVAERSVPASAASAAAAGPARPVSAP